MASSAGTTSEERRQRAQAAAKRGDTVKVFFQAVGSAPMLKKRKFRVSKHESFATVERFLRKQLHMRDGEPLVVYCNQTFCPNPDDSVDSLFRCFHSGGDLILNYSTTNAWG